MTGTPFCMLPVTMLDGQKIGDGKMGEATSLLLHKWSKNVNVDIIEQIKEYSDDAKKSVTPYQF